MTGLPLSEIWGPDVDDVCIHWWNLTTNRPRCAELSYSEIATKTLPAIQREVFEPGAKTWREHFANQDSSLFHIFNVIISSEKIFNNINAVLSKQVKKENSSLPVAVQLVLKPPITSPPLFLSIISQKTREQTCKGYKEVFSPFQMKDKNIFKFILAGIQSSRRFFVNIHGDFNLLGRT